MSILSQELVVPGEAKKSDPIYLLSEMEKKLHSQINKLNRLQSYKHCMYAMELRKTEKQVKNERREKERLENNKKEKELRDQKKQLENILYSGIPVSSLDNLTQMQQEQLLKEQNRKISKAYVGI